MHISHLSTEFVSNVGDVVSQGQDVSVRVLSFDASTGKIALSMVPEGEERGGRGGGGRRDFNNSNDNGGGGDFAAGGTGGDSPKRGKVASAGKRTGGVARERKPDLTLTKGQKVKGKIARAVTYGVFVELEGEDGVQGFLHSAQYGETPASALEVGAEVAELLVLGVDAKRRRVDLTLRSAEELAAEAEVAAKGAKAGAPVPAGASPLGAAFARAGLSKEAFGGSGEAAPEAAAAAAAAVVEAAQTAATDAAAAAAAAVVEAAQTAATDAAAADNDAEAESKNAEASATATAAAPAAAAVVEAAPAREAAPAASTPAAAAGGSISAVVVKALREKSGAGMMDCKKALAECGGDIAAAAEYLRKKGLASADKKASRAATEGAIGSYIHAGSALGVLIEVNCETDFVARGDRFQELVSDLAMQVAACPSVSVVAASDYPAGLLERERAIESAKEDLASKPENIRAKIVEGRVAKIASEAALLEQPFIKDSTTTVGEHIKAAVASIVENIQVRRFARFNLGEGIEKKSDDFAAEVAAQTGGV